MGESWVMVSGAETNLKVGGGDTSGSKSTIIRFGERFRDGQYSLASFLFAVLLLQSWTWPNQIQSDPDFHNLHAIQSNP